MASFALITEGETDQVVLEEIIQTIYIEKTGEEADVRVLQPLYDQTSKSRNKVFGGWEMLLDFCSDKDRVLEALATNDYLVIQIDTDISEHARINISRLKEPKELLSCMKTYLQENIDQETFEAYQDKFIFAVAVHSTECWLLPLHEEREKDKSQILNCEKRLTRALASKDINFSKTSKSFAGYAKGFQDFDVLEEARRHNFSLDHFIESLPTG
ncbi:MAG: hypothetical protein CMK99_20595 [Pseudomonas sp.]|nr:hypothetical protein [Pseudomonas sp.]|tara:strand:+ start:4228 stop:4869 length:642 start_codon:yes stop_codon:yes gene_type:complete